MTQQASPEFQGFVPPTRNYFPMFCSKMADKVASGAGLWYNEDLNIVVLGSAENTPEARTNLIRRLDTMTSLYPHAKNGKTPAYSVYALADPQTNEVRYIGSSRNVKRRYSQHLSHATSNQRKQAWINGLKINGLRPTLIILEDNLDKKQALLAEKSWLQIYLERGANLTNARDAELLPRECREVQG